VGFSFEALEVAKVACGRVPVGVDAEVAFLASALGMSMRGLN